MGEKECRKGGGESEKARQTYREKERGERRGGGGEGEGEREGGGGRIGVRGGEREKDLTQTRRRCTGRHKGVCVDDGDI